MEKIFRKSLLVIITAALTILFMGTGAVAFQEPFELFGKDLEIKGSLQQSMDLRTHRDERDVQISSLKSQIRIEADYQISWTKSLDVSLYTLAHYYFDNGDWIDQHQRDAIRHEDAGSHGLKNFRRTNELEEILKEFYLDFRGKTWEIRLGRQIVSWGETAFFQVADIVNPLDVTNIKVWPDFDDLKVGLWMIRLFYTPEKTWQGISFEFLFLPPDFQTTRLPPAGHGLFFGSPPMVDGVFGKLLHHMQHDTPGNDWNNSEWGVRIRGYTWGTDWTLQYFYGRLDGGLINRNKGFSQFLNLVLGLPVTDEIFRFPHFHSTALTFAKDVYQIKSTVRGEVVLSHKDYQYGTSDIKGKKILTTALSIDRSIKIPWLTEINRMRYLTAGLTWYHHKLIGHKYNKATGEFITWESGTRDSSWDQISLMMDYGFYWDFILPTFAITYDFNGSTTLMAVLKYAPGDHWRFQVSYQQLNEQGRVNHMQDQVMFSVQYEF